ncbi:DUF1653 domain-containing protein [Asticcacaulis sp. EMRT-3]|uniref:DUF1653 domain-containing protein n=1 Tax=Asticcacaulis sp. EMRT-3 TaxID=3040349 RepID=UPI0024AFFCF5|nr:DUF1653 domain-containing protein [Asticcacaulis sp. EMRT-3]MDI7773739.1 DUF1653 domain-containing protein [Asticcacaulis sp. EMRT-3]
MPLTTSFYKSDIKRGTYRHYKGKLYKVFGTVRHSETEETLVLYAPHGQEAGEAVLWVRPLAMFGETVETEQGPQPRFAFVEDIIHP